MATKKYLSGEQLQQALFKRTEGYAANVRAIYDKYLADIINVVKGTQLEDGKPFSFSAYGYTSKVQPLLRSMYSHLYQTIRQGVQKEWLSAEENNDELVKSVFGEKSIEDKHFARYFLRNEEAMNAFFARKTNGMNLSQRVWKLTGRYKEELEDSLDLAMGEGTPANSLATKIKKYLNEPDRFYRRFRVKVGEDEDGNQVFGRIWKRRIWSDADNSYKWINDEPGKYHPSNGVYRSSSRNAQRLARTETNIAYRTADYDRWQNFDFVVGVEIKLSNNHPTTDICDDLKGVYPKDFKWSGWHPNCRCYMVPVLKTQIEIERDTERILDGKEPLTESENTVRDVPQKSKDWLADNDKRLQEASSVPYFISDNPKYTGVQPHYGAIGAVTGTKLGRTATKAAFKIYEDMPATTLTAEVAANTEAIAKDLGIKGKPAPMTFLEANEGRGNVDYGKGYEFSINCQAAVAVHEARLRGLPVTALGYDETKGGISYKLGEHFELIWRSPKTGDTPTPTTIRGKDFNEMLAKIGKTTNTTGRYHIGINMSENKGHIITAERISKEQILFYDAQVGAFLKLEEYAASNVESFEVLKVDKLLLNKDIFRRIARLL